MTLCIAAISIGSRIPARDLSFAMVTVTDERLQTDAAGGNFAEKRKSITNDYHWHALFADKVSAADDFTRTLQTVLRPNEFTANNLVGKLTEGSSAFKEKLINRLVRLRLGMSFEHFLTHGEAEVPAEIRTRVWYEIDRLDYECELIVFGFLNGMPLMFEINRYGDVDRSEHFTAIGSGAVIAESVLYQREQHLSTELNQTLYNVYEAFRIACKANAPGVAGGPLIWVFEPEIGDRDLIIPRFVTKSGLKISAKCFDRYGPKKTKNVPTLKDDDFFTLPDYLLFEQREERLRARFRGREDESTRTLPS